MGTPQNEIRENLQRRGIIVSRNNMSKILKRIEYAGKIIIPEEVDEPMRIIEGIHEVLVRESVFFQVQEMLSGNRKARGKYIPKYAKIREDFHLRGVINCNACGHTMTSSFSRGKLGKRYGYYHCNHCKGQRASSIKVHEAFDKLLNSIKIKPSIGVVYEEILAEQMGHSDRDSKQEIQKLKEQLNQISERLERSQDLMLDGKLNADEYVSIKSRYSVQQNEIKAKMSNLKASTSEFSKLAQSGMSLLSNITETYYTETIQLKHKIVGSIFFEKLSFDGKRCRTPKMNSFFELIASLDRQFRENKRGQPIFLNQLSPSAERGGFEPPLRYRKHAFQACAFSHSATSPYFNYCLVQPPDSYRDCHLSVFQLLSCSASR
jgi:site-specific DNA recombinase